MAARGVVQQRGVRFSAFEDRFDAEALTETPGQPADRDGLRARQIQDRRRRLAQRERSQADRVSVALPDDACMTHGEIDRLALEHFLSYIQQHSVSKIDSVVEPQNRYRRAITRGKVLEHAFAAKGRLRIFSYGPWRRGFGGPALQNGHEWINK